LLQKRVSQSREWEDVSVDLSSYHGDVVLELQTTGSNAPLAAWGSPIVTAPGASSLPYNALFIVVDALRSDALASAHDPDQDARLRKVPLAPFDAWLPAMPEVAPNLDRLASVGTTFVRAWSAAMWTRPSTLAMLTGMRAGRLGLPVLELEPKPADVRTFYALNPPLWPLLMRAHGAVTRAVINNMYLCGYVGVGVDTGFEAMTDHRYQVNDTDKITTDTVAWLRAHRDERFSLFVNYVSPHAPYVPESKYLQPIERASPHPDNRQVRRYLGEIRKDDAAIGRVLDELKELGLTSNTIVVVTADHGEALSEAHDWVAVDVAKGVHSGRFTHLSTMWEEAARVPLVLALPGVVPAKKRVTQQVQTTDILPTLLELLGIDVPKEIDGVSLRPLWSDAAVAERPAVIEGRGAVSIIDGRWHYIQRSPIARHLQLGSVDFEKALELYDLSNDPGERQDVSAQHPDEVSRLRSILHSRLAARAANETHQLATSATVHVRVSAGSQAGELVGDISVLGGRVSATSQRQTVSIQTRSSDSVRVSGPIAAGSILDLDLRIEPASANVDWNWTFAGAPWPKAAYHIGPLGLVRDLSKGLRAEDSNSAVAQRPAYVDGSREQGIFVTRDTDNEVDATISQAAQAEAQQAMQAWGYVRKSETSRKSP
jgi:arylsulfatase A-like enzyme